MNKCDVIIVGAGPYGLSAAAHLRTIKGLQLRIFGEAMALWKHNMPAGMFLRSPPCASHIAHPEGKLSFDHYVAQRGERLTKPIPLAQFIDYGCWFQQQAVPDLDTRNIRDVAPTAEGFQVTTDDGEVLSTRRVVVAAGPGPFKWRPPEFNDLPKSLASHSLDHKDLSRFRGKRVLVVGAGQSALENAALLHETGAAVEIATRSPNVHWLRWRGRVFRILPFAKFLYSPRDVGPAGVSQLIARPDLYRKLPRKFQDWGTRRALRPAGALWLMDRLNNVKIRTSVSLSAISVIAEQLRVRFSDSSEGLYDHVMFATGFKADLAKYSFFGPEILARIDKIGGFPKLKTGLESSVAGLHFLGAPSGWSFGPVARFVSGTFYSPAAVTRAVAARQ